MQFFGPLRAKAKAFSSLDFLTAMRLLFSTPEVQEEVIYLNTFEQLFAKGINANGETLESIGGSYAQKTIEIKNELGLPTDRVTLRQTGEFYESFEVYANPDFFTIEADTIKEEGGATFDLRERWGLEILGLNEESKERLAVFLREIIIQLLREDLG